MALCRDTKPSYVGNLRIMKYRSLHITSHHFTSFFCAARDIILYFRIVQIRAIVYKMESYTSVSNFVQIKATVHDKKTSHIDHLTSSFRTNKGYCT